MTSKPSTLAEYVAELDRLIEQPLPSFDPMNPNSAMKFVKASILKNHRLNTAGVLRDLVETAADRPLAPRITWTDRNGTRLPGFLSYDEAMQQAYDWNERAGQTEERLAHEQEANARLLKTIEEVCSERDHERRNRIAAETTVCARNEQIKRLTIQLQDDNRNLMRAQIDGLEVQLEQARSERDEALVKLSEVQGRLSDLMGYITDEEQPESEPEPGQCWRVIRNGNIYRWYDVHPIDPVIQLWSQTDKHWRHTVWESFTAIEKEYGDLEPVENPESNA